MSKRHTLVRALRVISGCALVGTVTAGAFFGWVPAVGAVGIHEVGAIVGAGFGIFANAKHLV